jgi:hypothetical protein
MYQINGEARTYSLKAISKISNRINFNRTINSNNSKTEEDIVVVGAIITREKIFIRMKEATKIKEAVEVEAVAAEVIMMGASKTGNNKTITFSSKTK